MRSSLKTSITSSTLERFPTCGKLKKGRTSSIPLGLSMRCWKDLSRLKQFIVLLWKESGRDCMWSCQWVQSAMPWGYDAGSSQLWSTAAQSTGSSLGPKRLSWVLQPPSWKNTTSFHPIRISLREAIPSKLSLISAKRFTSQPTNKRRNSKQHSKGRFTQHRSLI